MPTAYVLSTGSELCNARSKDTNSPYIASKLIEVGFSILGLGIIPDDPSLLYTQIKKILELPNLDLVIMTGGLGPTADDHTIDVLSKLCKKKIIEHSYSLEKLILRAQEKSSKISLNLARRQIRVLEDAEILLNEVGLAPGLIIKKPTQFQISNSPLLSYLGFSKKLIRVASFKKKKNEVLLCAMPGVPREMRPMLETSVLPFVQNYFFLKSASIKLYRSNCYLYDLTESKFQNECFGKNESSLISFLPPPPISFKWGVSAELGYIKVFWESNSEAYNKQLEDSIQKHFKKHYLKEDVRKLLHEYCLKNITENKNFRIGTAESCTGGLIAKMLTDLPEASKYFYGSFICYQNEMKIKELGVEAKIIDTFGAVSKECTEAMSLCLLKKLGLDYALAITGLAGPDPITKAKTEPKTGTIYIALASKASLVDNKTEILELHANYDREGVREYAAQLALFYFYKTIC